MLERLIRIESWYKRYKIPLIILVALLVVGGVGYSLNNYYQEQQSQKNAQFYQKALMGDENAITSLKDSQSKLYDLYLFQKALKETCSHRQSSDILKNSDSIISNIESSPEILQRWNKYQKENLYARDITFPVLINSLRTLLNNPEAD